MGEKYKLSHRQDMHHTRQKPDQRILPQSDGEKGNGHEHNGHRGNGHKKNRNYLGMRHVWDNLRTSVASEIQSGVLLERLSTKQTETAKPTQDTQTAHVEPIDQPAPEQQQTEPEIITMDTLSLGPKVSVDMFNPDPARVNMRDLITQFYGKEAVAYAAHRFPSKERRSHLRSRKMEYLRDHPEMTAREYDKTQRENDKRYLSGLRERVNLDRFEQAVQDAFNLADTDNPLDFYTKQASHANNTVRYTLGHTVPRYRGVYDLKTEPGQILRDKDDLFDFALGDVDPRVQFEIRRQLLLGVISGEIDRYLKLSGVERRMPEVTRIFDEKLFLGKRGESRRKDYVVIHDLKTNAVTRMYDLSITPEEKIQYDPSSERRTDLPLEMRQFDKSGIYARYDPRTKNTPSAVTKALRKAIVRKEAGGDPTVYPLQDAKDLVGIKFIVDPGLRKDGAISGEAVEEQNKRVVNKALIQIFDMLVENGLSSKIIDVNEDHNTNGTPGQNPEVSYKRIQVKTIGDNNLPITYEIIVQCLRDYINEDGKVGTFDNDTERYMGPWHSGYETERLMEGKSGGVLTTIFPDKVYNKRGKKVDILQEAKNTKNRKAESVLLP